MKLSEKFQKQKLMNGEIIMKKQMKRIISTVLTISYIMILILPATSFAAIPGVTFPVLDGYLWTQNAIAGKSPISQTCSHHQGFTLDKITDGNPETAGVMNQGELAPGKKGFIVYDLEAAYKIGGATLDYSYRTAVGYNTLYGASSPEGPWTEILRFDDISGLANVTDKVETKYLDKPADAPEYRYIKLEGEKPGGVYKIYELEIYAVVAVHYHWTQNLILGKSPVSQTCSHHQGFTLDWITDGNPETAGVMNQGELAPGEKGFIVYDLEAAYKIGGATLDYSYRTAVGYNTLYGASSPEGPWTEILRFDDISGLANVTDKVETKYLDKPADAPEYRYIKLEGEKPGGVYKIYELEIYAVVAKGIELYASPVASENADGTQDFPFDIYSAAEMYRKYAAMGINVDSINLLSGDYYLDKTLELDSSYSGLKLQGIGNVNIYGSYKIEPDMISVADESDCGGRLPAELIGEIVKIDLSGYAQNEFLTKSNYKDYSEINVSVTRTPKDTISDIELFDNAVPKICARWPDDTWENMGKITTIDEQTAEFVTSNNLKWSENADDIKIFNFRYADYFAMPGDITEINPENKTATISQKLLTAKFNVNSRYYFYNIPEEITKKGEYYINIDEKAAYYYPENINDMKLSVSSMSGGFFNIKAGAKNILFDNIHFSQLRGTAITATLCENIDITDCKFTCIGGSGVYIENSTKCDLAKNMYDNIGYMSVYISGGDRPSLTPGENTIYDSRFTNGGRIAKTYSPFLRIRGVGTSVKNNHFYNHSSHAIIFEGNNHSIENNIFDTCVTESHDSGAIYAGGNTTCWGNVIKNNIFKNIRNDFMQDKYDGVFAVYMDDLLPGTVIEGNVFYDCSSTINIGGGRGTKIRDNFIYDCYKGGAVGYREETVKDWLTIPNNDININTSGACWNWIKNMREQTGYDEDKWYNQYPAYKQLVEDLEIQLDENGKGNGNVAEAHKLKDTEFSGNLMIGELSRISSTEDYPFEMFVYTYSARENNPNANGYCSNGIYTNNFNTDMLWDITITGKRIEGIEDLFDSYIRTNSDGNHFLAKDSNLSSVKADITQFKMPDVSKAGTVTIDVSDIFNENEQYVTAKDRTEYAGAYNYRIEDFKNTQSEDIKALNSFSFSTSSIPKPAVDTTEGRLNIPAQASVSVKPDKTFEGESAVCVSLEGNAEIKLIGDIVQTYTVSPSFCTLFEYAVNGLSEIEIKNTSASNELYVDYIAVNKKGNTKTDGAYFKSDFEECQPGISAKTANDNAFTLFTIGYGGAYIHQEANGNKAVRIFKEGKPSNGYLEFHFEPINLCDKVLCIEYSVKKETDNGRLFASLALDGFNSDKPTFVRQIAQITQDKKYNLSFGGVVLASEKEMTEDYVHIRWLIDRKNSTLKAYKLTENGYELITTQRNDTICEFAKNIKFAILNEDAPDDRSSFLVDDIAVYDYDMMNIRTQDGTIALGVNDNKGKNVYLMPVYLPQTQIGTIIAAIYDQDNKLINTTIADYKPNQKLELFVPDDGNEYSIKYFSWENIGGQIPVNDAIEFK